MKSTRFVIETYLNDIFKGKGVTLVRLKGLIHLPKYQKMPRAQIFDSYLTEAVEIVEALARVRGVEIKDLREALNPEKIRSIKSLTERVGSQKVKEIMAYIKENIVPYLEGKF
jgi:hypothetical protein